MYSEAIFCKIAPEKKSVLYCNRSLANLKLENNAIALLDGCEAIKLDATNVKGYYRRGQAYAGMRQLKNAVDDFKKICQMQPSNKDTREKYELTLKEYKAQKLSQALSYDDNKKILVDVNDIFVEKSYAGPRLDSIDDINSDWIVAMMKWQKD